MKEIIRKIVLSLIPTFLIYIGRSDSFFTFLKTHKFINQDSDTTESQLYCFIIGIFWAGVVTPIQLARTKNNLTEKDKQFDGLLAFNKETYFKSIKETLKKHNKNFRTRIFIPRTGLKAWWNSFRYNKMEFMLKEINGISDPLNARTLHFEVSPKQQGLVGKACREKAIIVDCNAKAETYNLTPYQISKTSDVKFCSTAPIFNNKNEVIAVLAIDSSDDIPLNDAEIQQWKDLIIYYCAFVDKHLKF